MIDSIQNNSVDYDIEFINSLVSYLNSNCANIKEYSKLEKILTFIINQENSVHYMNSLSLNFSFEELDNLCSIEDIMGKYISNNLYNDTIKNYIYSFRNNSNIDSVFKGFDDSIQIMKQDFLNCYVKYVTEVNIISFNNNIDRIVKLYYRYDNKSELLLNFKSRKALKNVYDCIESSTNKEKFVLDVLNMQLTFEEKMDNMFLYESASDRFKNFIDNEFNLLNVLMIVKKVEKKSNLNLGIDKIVSLIEDKDNILQNEFDSILEILKIQSIDKNNTKKIIKCLIDKVDSDCIKKICDSIEITDERIKKLIDKKLSEKELQTV